MAGAYLTNATDAHAQGVSVAARAIQDLGCQLHHQALSPRVTLECTGGGGVIIPRKPLVVTALVLDIVVGGALLGSEVLRVGRAVLDEEKGHTRVTRGDGELWTRPPSPRRPDPPASLLRVPSFPLNLRTHSCGILAEPPQ